MVAVMLSSRPTSLIQMYIVLSWIILKVFCCGICAPTSIDVHDFFGMLFCIAICETSVHACELGGSEL